MITYPYTVPTDACVGCDGDGSLSKQWAKAHAVTVGGLPMTAPGRTDFWYETPDGKCIEEKTIGGVCPCCNGSKVKRGRRFMICSACVKCHALNVDHSTHFNPLTGKPCLPNSVCNLVYFPMDKEIYDLLHPRTHEPKTHVINEAPVEPSHVVRVDGGPTAGE
jgi:hypothetical protein